jgi:hypothetical protein
MTQRFSIDKTEFWRATSLFQTCLTAPALAQLGLSNLDHYFAADTKNFRRITIAGESVELYVGTVDGITSVLRRFALTQLAPQVF